VIGITTDDGGIRCILPATFQPIKRARGSTLEIFNQSPPPVKLAQDYSPKVAYQCARPVKNTDNSSTEVAHQKSRPVKHAGNHCLDVASGRAPSPDLTDNSSGGQRKTQLLSQLVTINSGLWKDAGHGYLA